MHARLLFAVSTFLLASVVNPAYFAGCVQDESEPDFGEPEMLELLDAVNEQGRWQFENAGAQYEIEFSLMQAAGADSHAAARTAMFSGATAHACGSRTFMNSAAACLTVSQLIVEGEFTLRELAPTPRVVASAVAVTGNLTAPGNHLRSASLDLRFGDSFVTLETRDASTFELQNLHARSRDLGDVDLEIDHLEPGSR
jgi:hypothetical protein